MPLASLTAGHVSDRWHAVSNCSGCSNASGELHIKASMATRHALCLHRHDSLPIAQPTIAVGLGWERLPGGAAIDLDASCVCVDHKGEVLMRESPMTLTLSLTITQTLSQTLTLTLTLSQTLTLTLTLSLSLTPSQTLSQALSLTRCSWARASTSPT